MKLVRYSVFVFSMLAGLGAFFLLSDGAAAGERATAPLTPPADLPLDVQEQLRHAAEGTTAAAAIDFAQACAGGCGTCGGLPPCDEPTQSLGRFKLRVPAGKFIQYFAGYPGWQSVQCGSGSVGRLVSPLLRDSATIIGRSEPHLHGDFDDTGGTPVGDDGVMVSDANFSVLPTGFQGPANTREIHTEIVTLNLFDAGSGVSVRAGTLAPAQPRSFGEVEREAGPGGPPDAPAESFFDVFVEVDLPAMMNLPGNLTLKNTEALLVQAAGLNNLPPQVVYIHGNTKAVRVYAKNAGPSCPGVNCEWNINDTVGWLELAGHGVGSGPGTCVGGTQDGLPCNGPGDCPGGTCQGSDPLDVVCAGTAMQPDVPAASAWGLAALTLLVLAAGTVVLRRSTGMVT